MRFMLIAAVSLALLAGCRAAPDEAAAPNQAVNEASPQAASPAQPVAVEDKDDFLEFSYGYPAQAAAIPELDAWLRGNMDEHRKRMAALARADADDAKKTDRPFHGYSYSQTWSVTADTPALLVLQADGYEFTGGAHGMPFVATLIWDKTQRQRLATSALLDPAALARASKARFCKELDAQRAEKRGEPIDPQSDDGIPEFVQCSPLEKQEIVPVSSGGKAIDLVRVVIMPYEAGPYVEGSYVIDLPMNAALMGAVKPAWKSAFAPK